MVSDDVYTYDYNDANKLAVAKNASDNNLIARYYYDHSGNRVKKVIYSGAGTKIVYSFDKLFETRVYGNGSVENTSFYLTSPLDLVLTA